MRTAFVCSWVVAGGLTLTNGAALAQGSLPTDQEARRGLQETIDNNNRRAAEARRSAACLHNVISNMSRLIDTAPTPADGERIRSEARQVRRSIGITDELLRAGQRGCELEAALSRTSGFDRIETGARVGR